MIIYGGIQQNGIILSVHTKTVDTSLKRSIKKNIWKQDICATWILQFMINMETNCELSFSLSLRISWKVKLFPGIQREESQVARMGWSRVIRFSEVSLSKVCISVILSFKSFRANQMAFLWRIWSRKDSRWLAAPRNSQTKRGWVEKIWWVNSRQKQNPFFWSI